MQFVHGRRKGVEQLSKWIDNVLFVAATVRVHPQFGIIFLQIAKEPKRIRRENCSVFGHRCFSVYIFSQDSSHCQLWAVLRIYVKTTIASVFLGVLRGFHPRTLASK